MSETRDVVVEGLARSFVQRATVGPHSLAVDEPTDLGGTDTGPNPYELLLAALGACTSMTVGLYARKKGWPLEDVKVVLRHRRIHAKDCADCPDPPPKKLDDIELVLTLVGPLTAEQKARLVEIAEKCPVHQTLSGPIHMRARAVED